MDDEKVSKKDTFVFGVGLATTLLIFGLSLTLFAVRNFPDILPKVGDHLKINSGSFKPQETPPADNSNNQIQKENKVTDYTNFKIEILNATNRKGVAKDLLTKLGKHKEGGGCLYINKLSDVDQKILATLIDNSFHAKRMYST